MQPAETVLTVFTVAAGLSLGIERGLELLTHFMDLGNGTLDPKEQGDSMKRAADLIGNAEQALAQRERTDAAPDAVKSTSPGGEQAAQSQQEPSIRRTAADSEASEKYPPPRSP